MKAFYSPELQEVLFIYNVFEYDYKKLYCRFLEAGHCRHPEKKKGAFYNNIFGTFDIETTTVNCAEISKKYEHYGYQAFMYLWQARIDGVTVMGRTWQELQYFLYRIIEVLPPTDKMVWYIFYLPFEFQFIRDYFTIDNVFATNRREVLKCDVNAFLEFRCAYRLSNMSLAKFIKNTPGAKYNKQSGDDYDYSKLRTPSTPLVNYELTYAYCDVAGLEEAIKFRLADYGDTLATIPLTSTGYVRREARAAFNKNPSNKVMLRDMRIDEDTYIRLRTARRGGNSHCNPFWSNQLLSSVGSYDMSSAYPAVMLQCKFPMSEWFNIAEDKQGVLYRLDENLCYLITIVFEDLSLKSITTIPYLPTAKAIQFEHMRADNGRVIKAKKYGVVITEIDFKIIDHQYNYSGYEILDVKAAYKDYLFDEFRQYIFERYKLKCELKKGDKYLYNKEKNKINANFGMMLTDIVHKKIIYNEHATKPFTIECPDVKKGLYDYFKSPNSFLSYAHGVYVTAHCRWRLQRAIDELGYNVVYCDTDSAKYIIDEYKDFNYFDNIFARLNAEIEEDVKKCGFNTNYTTSYGETFKLGYWEEDGKYEYFKSLGAKKYALEEDGEFKITVAGLSKDKGARYLSENGKFDSFTPNTVIPSENSGRTASKFNDIVTPITIIINGEEIELRSNIAVTNVSYTFTITDDYRELLEEVQTASFN